MTQGRQNIKEELSSPLLFSNEVKLNAPLMLLKSFKVFSKIVLIWFTSFFVTFSTVQANEAGTNSKLYEAFNLGLAKCEKVVSNYDEVESVELGLKLWLGGYFTAMNSLSNEPFGVTNGKDITEITELVIRECELRPMSRIADVTSDVIFSNRHQ